MARGIAVFPWLRLIGVSVGLIAAPRVDIFATTRVALRVWPNDLDFNLHVNNGRYLALADIGRLDWFVRTGALQIARQRQALPVVGDAMAKFRRDLKVFQGFEIHTRLIGWDSKWGFIEHRFVRDRRVVGMVVIRGVFTGPRRSYEAGSTSRGTRAFSAIAGIARMDGSFPTEQRTLE